MKPLFATSCLLAHNFWSAAVSESLHFAVEYDKLGNNERFLAHVSDALDAAFRSGDWLRMWREETKQSV